MAYIALYRKYRPQTFTDVVGQHQVSDTFMRICLLVREGLVRRVWPRFSHALSIASMGQRIILVTSVVLVNRF